MEKYDLERINTMQDGGYYLVKAPIGYPGAKYGAKYAPEHRVIYWMHHGSLPPNGYHIHHINGDPKDNRIENLQAVTAAEHVKMAGHIADKIEEHTVLTCYHCREEFQQTEASVKFREKQGQNQFFCSHSCHTTYKNYLRKGVKNKYPENRKPAQRKGINLSCKVCKKEFYVSKSRELTAKVCSKACSNLLKTCTFR